MSEDAPYDPEKPLWSIMTKSFGGAVSVIRNLTLEEARLTYERLDPWYGDTRTCSRIHPDFIKDGLRANTTSLTYGRTAKDGDIEVREVFGPHGWRWFEGGQIEEWPKYEYIYTDADGNILPDEYQEDPTLAAFYRRLRTAEAEASAKKTPAFKGLLP